MGRGTSCRGDSQIVADVAEINIGSGHMFETRLHLDGIHSVHRPRMGPEVGTEASLLNTMSVVLPSSAKQSLVFPIPLYKGDISDLG